MLKWTVGVALSLTLCLFVVTGCAGSKSVESSPQPQSTPMGGESEVVKPTISTTEKPQPVELAPSDRAAMVAKRKADHPHIRWWNLMDYGPFVTGVVHIASTKCEALKGMCIELGEDGDNVTFTFDTDLLRGAALFEGRTVRHGTPYDGAHGRMMRTTGDEWLATIAGPGWSKAGKFDDPRDIPHGRLPTSWAKYRGLYRHGEQITLEYTVGDSRVLDHPAVIRVGEHKVFVRDINISERAEKLYLDLNDGDTTFVITEDGLRANGDKIHLHQHSTGNARFELRDDKLVLAFPAGPAARLRLAVSREAIPADAYGDPIDLQPLLEPGAALYPQRFTLSGNRAPDSAAYVVDDIPVPMDNPWHSNLRLGGFDFFADGKSAALCTWNGDVWLVSGIDDDLQHVTWKRYATGLYETLGLKIVDDVIYVHGRDQLTRLHDGNGDGEADYYECFNNDVMTTRNFHEFAFDLKTDADGNFYFSKAGPVKAGGRGFDEIAPHNGTVMKVSRDGSSLEVVATGLRAPNGIGIGPHGELTSGDNEGTSVPHSRINWFGAGKFACVPDTAHGENTDHFTPPLCWMPMEIDNSSGDQAWVPDDRWGPFQGDMLHLSYGTCFLLKVMRQDLPDGKGVQGGVFRIPVNLASGSMRSRFNARDGQLYICGLRGWQTTAARPTAWQRCRYTGQDVDMPRDLRFTEKGVYITWTGAISADEAAKPSNYSVARWNYVWGKAYGSGEFSVDHPDQALVDKARTENTKGHVNRDQVWVRSATLLDDGKTVFLDIPDMKPCHQMSIRTKLRTPAGKGLQYEIYGTVNETVFDGSAPIHPEIAKRETLRPGLLPGLKVSLATPSGRDAYIAPIAAIDYRTGEAPSALLAPREGVNQVQFNGWLRLPESIDCEFRVARNAGQVIVRLDGNPQVQLLQTVAKESSGKLSLEPGDHELLIEVEGHGNGTAAFRLLWSRDGGPFETVPADFLFHEPDAELEQNQRIREGRELYATHQCSACHDRSVRNTPDAMPELAFSAPDLIDAGARFNEDWLAAWISDPSWLRARARMPKTVENPQEAADIAAWLASQGASTKTKTLNAEHGQAATAEPETKASIDGGILFHEFGCIGCHTRPDQKPATDDPRLSLAGVANKFTPDGLDGFLENPRQHHAANRMPNFGLTRDEAEQLASWLRYAANLEPVADIATERSADRGERLFQKRGCASCHADTDPQLPAPTVANGDGCIDGSAGPRFDFSASERTALHAFIEHGLPGLTFRNAAETATRLTNEFNCNGCHVDGERQDQFSVNFGESKDLLPAEVHRLDQSRPPLTWMSESVRPEHLRSVVQGTREGTDRPWIAARMPSFPEPVAQALASGLPRVHAAALGEGAPKHDPAAVERGAKLAKDFACSMCHAIGEKKADLAFEVEGINLARVHDRISYDFFRRWMHEPQRYWHATKMQKYPFENAQLEDLWRWLETLPKP